SGKDFTRSRCLLTRFQASDGHDKAPESCRQRTMKSAPQCGQLSAARLPSDTPHAVMHLQIIEAGGRFTWRYVANGSHCRAKCGSGLTASAWRAELTKRLDVKRPSIRARGTWSEYRSRIFWIDVRRTRAATQVPSAKRPCR